MDAGFAGIPASTSWDVGHFSGGFPFFLLQVSLNWRSLGHMHFAQAADLEIDSAMTLNQVRVGCDVQIRVLSGPGCERLRDLGFCEELTLRKLAGGRNLICSICGTRMAISRELAEQVLVSPLS
jgi:ferrous iron transport protein A